MTFRVGQKIVCVNDTPDPGRIWLFLRGHLKKGRTYTYIGAGPPDYHGETTVCVAEAENDRRGFRASRFRPLVERKTETGMAILREILDRESHQDRVPAKT